MVSVGLEDKVSSISGSNSASNGLLACNSLKLSARCCKGWDIRRRPSVTRASHGNEALPLLRMFGTCSNNKMTVRPNGSTNCLGSCGLSGPAGITHNLLIQFIVSG